MAEKDRSVDPSEALQMYLQQVQQTDPRGSSTNTSINPDLRQVTYTRNDDLRDLTKSQTNDLRPVTESKEILMKTSELRSIHGAADKSSSTDDNK